MEIRKYDIWLAALPRAASSRVLSGLRPVIIISGNEFPAQNPVVTAIPLTSHLDKPQEPTHALITANENSHLACNSRAQVAHMTAVDKRLLHKRIGRVEDNFEQLSLLHALAIHLELNT